jgi:hypothetical protein
MNLLRCDRCERTAPVDEAGGWLMLTRDSDTTTWHFCSVTCLAGWSADAL